MVNKNRGAPATDRLPHHGDDDDDEEEHADGITSAVRQCHCCCMYFIKLVFYSLQKPTGGVQREVGAVALE